MKTWKMNELALEKFEADVVIVMSSTTFPVRGRIHPLWECKLKDDALLELAANLSLEFNEEIGHGEVDFKVIDFRTDEEE